ncbi:hypothetical protein EVAR_47791_1 [Eumeta japonica]|uniref:Uncharacterized protein n=1 Tax=Eumeta variegata TaxID=151549 RepID=A0A4C1ZB95_EUMVA|nr:hypothetical protein EVAR_47791_1 [Eumeta japonica]
MKPNTPHSAYHVAQPSVRLTCHLVDNHNPSQGKMEATKSTPWTEVQRLLKCTPQQQGNQKSDPHQLAIS